MSFIKIVLVTVFLSATGFAASDTYDCTFAVNSKSKQFTLTSSSGTPAKVVIDDFQFSTHGNIEYGIFVTHVPDNTTSHWFAQGGEKVINTILFVAPYSAGVRCEIR